MNPLYDASLRYRERHLAEGLCRECSQRRAPKPDGTESVFCEDHLVSRRLKRRERRRRQRARRRTAHAATS